MAQLVSNKRDIEFVLHEQLNIEDITGHEKYKEYQNSKTIDLIINEAYQLAVKEMLPANPEGDKEGCRYAEGKVSVPKCYHRLYNLMRAGGWFAMCNPPSVGGQGMPRCIATPVNELFAGANLAFSIYGGLTLGTGELIESFGTEKQKHLFLKKLFTGEYGGSMLLTEPEAGSDVGALSTTATPNDDGTYSIKGNKIFVTAVEQDLTENIIHPVLARIDGAPMGTRGISLFLVPKIWVNDDGSLGETNDIRVTGIEHKMGLKGSATCSVTLGEKENCRGLLLGEPDNGIKAMFQMMNYARLGTGTQGFALASTAYMYALDYCRKRIQGKHILNIMDDNASSVPIIKHPDVRRMLMTMKSYVQGMRSFIYFVSTLFDRASLAEESESADYYNDLVSLLTPVVKAYCTNKGMEITTMAVQCYGGYGYTRDYPVEQLMRDCKITQIYEGTNGIQSIDFLGRKLGMKQGRVFLNLVNEIKKTVQVAKEIPILENLAVIVEKMVEHFAETAQKIGQKAMSEKILTAFTNSHPFLEISGDVIMAWMHLWRASTAAPKLEKISGSLEWEIRKKMVEKNKTAAFYEGILKTADYYIQTQSPVISGKMNAVIVDNDSVIDIPDVSF